jgi:hypothetical protein
MDSQQIRRVTAATRLNQRISIPCNSLSSSSSNISIKAHRCAKARSTTTSLEIIARRQQVRLTTSYGVRHHSNTTSICNISNNTNVTQRAAEELAIEAPTIKMFCFYILLGQLVYLCFAITRFLCGAVEILFNPFAISP